MFNRKIIDQAFSCINLLTLEALHIRKERPAINTRDGFRSRELTLGKRDQQLTRSKNSG